MQELVTLITCTGFRPEAFALCKKYIESQTYQGPWQWIIIDDSHTMTPMNEEGIEVYHGPVKWEPSKNTHRFNMEEALKHVKGKYILIIEDDDFYSPKYIEVMVGLLKTFNVVGEGNAKYFNLAVPGYREMFNGTHASLAQTGLRASELPLLQKAVDSGELYFDIAFWKSVMINRIPNLIFKEANLCVGIKGMPGRIGIGVGHKNDGFTYDSNLTKLEEWAGKAIANQYRPFIKKYERKLNVTPNSQRQKNPQANAANVQISQKVQAGVLRHDKRGEA